MKRLIASPEIAGQLQKAEQSTRNGYRLLAHTQEPADALPAERSAAIRRLVSGDLAKARAMYDLHGADLSGLDLSVVSICRRLPDSANLTGTVRRRRNTTNAVLAHARMAGCIL